MTLNIRFVGAGEVTELKAVDSLVIEMFRSGKYTGDRDGLNGFRPAKILKDGAPVWTFQTSGAKPLVEYAEIVEYDDEYIIVIRDKFTISSIVRVNDFTHSAMAKLGGRMVMVGGSGIEDILNIKIAIAGELGIDYWKSPEENKILQVRAERLREIFRQNQAEQIAAKAAKTLARETFVREIMSRNTVEAWSQKGQKFYGIPVTTDEEWTALPDGKYCIMMKEDKPVEAFIVDKKSSRVKKARTTEVSAEMPKQKADTVAEEAPEALDQVSVTVRGETRSVLIFEDMSALKKLQASGLNSGTWVGLQPSGNKPMTVYAIRKNGIDTVGNVTRKNLSE